MNEKKEGYGEHSGSGNCYYTSFRCAARVGVCGVDES